MVIPNFNLRRSQQNLSKVYDDINNKTNRPRTIQDLKRNISLQRLVNHETHTVFLVCEVNQGVTLFDDLSATYLREDNSAKKNLFRLK